jgi:hypothetical protein
MGWQRASATMTTEEHNSRPANHKEQPHAERQLVKMRKPLATMATSSLRRRCPHNQPPTATSNLTGQPRHRDSHRRPWEEEKVKGRGHLTHGPSPRTHIRVEEKRRSAGSQGRGRRRGTATARATASAEEGGWRERRHTGEAVLERETSAGGGVAASGSGQATGVEGERWEGAAAPPGRAEGG